MTTRNDIERTYGLQLRKFRGLNRHRMMVTYWVGMRRPQAAGPDDYEMVEVTGRYLTLSALEAALVRGDGWR